MNPWRPSSASGPTTGDGPHLLAGLDLQGVVVRVQRRRVLVVPQDHRVAVPGQGVVRIDHLALGSRVDRHVPVSGACSPGAARTPKSRGRHQAATGIRRCRSERRRAWAAPGAARRPGGEEWWTSSRPAGGAHALPCRPSGRSQRRGTYRALRRPNTIAALARMRARPSLVRTNRKNARAVAR